MFIIASKKSLGAAGSPLHSQYIAVLEEISSESSDAAGNIGWIADDQHTFALQLKSAEALENLH